MGSNKSATMSLTTNSGITYGASIVDGSAAGVYRVNYSLPKTQTAGSYNLNVYLRGNLVPTSRVTVLACTNAHAYEWNYVAASGNTVNRGAVEYTI